MAPGTVKLRESLQQSWRIYLVLRCMIEVAIVMEEETGRAASRTSNFRLPLSRVLKNSFCVNYIIYKSLIIKGHFSPILAKHGYFNTLLVPSKSGTTPPTTSTLPSGSNVAHCPERW